MFTLARILQEKVAEDVKENFSCLFKTFFVNDTFFFRGGSVGRCCCEHFYEKNSHL